ncbi:MAG: TolC family protein [Candidatus Eremiobacteraeota bacterium]|nr:TolC family protein [Candidatus Eremiobacteraeota bacterium]
MVMPVLVLAAIPAFAQLSLADAQARTVANDVDVQTAIAAVRQKDAALALARGSAVPHLVGDYVLNPQANAAAAGTIEQYTVTVGLNVSLNDIIGASPATSAAAADLLSAQRNGEAAVLRARERAIRLYFAALQAIATESVRASDLAGAERDRDAASLRWRTGEAPQIDVVRADVSLAQARAALVRAQADRADAVDALASATAVTAASLSATGGALPAFPPVLDEARATQRALAMRPELASLLASVDARRANVASARDSGIPSASVDAGYATGTDTGIGVHGAAVSAHVDIPIAPGTNARVTSAQADVDIASAQLIDERRTILLEVTSAVRDERALESALRGADSARDEAARALAAVETGYREGASSSLDVEEARRTYAQAENDALAAQYALAQARSTLEVMVP